MTGEAEHPSGDSGPLDGVRVLDASRVLAGPFCGMQLGDLGADVVKVERPDGGDQTRGWAPPAFGEQSAYYASCNRNKRSVTLNLGSAEGRGLFRELAADADVLLHNFRVGKMREWGLDYDALSDLNPGLVYCHVSGYGEWGPDADRPAYDLVMQAESGIMSFTGVPDAEPVRVGVAITDLAAGMYASQAVLAALFEREVGDGAGQKLDVSLFDAATALTSYMAATYFASGDPPGKMGSRHPNIAPYQAFSTADDWVVVAVPSQHMWPRFCRALDRPDLVEHPDFATNEARVTNRDALEAELAPEFEAMPTGEAVAVMEDHGVPATPVRDVGEAFASPQAEARGMRQTVQHPEHGAVTVPGSPFHFSRSRVDARRHPPDLGEHTADVLRELGYDEAAVERFRADDVV